MSKIVTLDQKQRLEKLGFEYDIHQVYFIHNNSKDITRQVVGVEEIFLDEFKDNYSPIPTTASALDWIREEKGVACGVEPDYNTVKVGEYYAGGYGFNGNVVKVVYKYKYQYYDKNNELHSKKFDTHPLAESALLDAVLTYLEEKK